MSSLFARQRVEKDTLTLTLPHFSREDAGHVTSGHVTVTSAAASENASDEVLLLLLCSRYRSYKVLES